ncbi:MAG: DUF4407 domain-containing protein, partial [Bacteroidetes bacterium]|nr:DUF4407 domain-containing protein [Bacteroidota bacterium]
MNSQHYQLKQPSRFTRFLWWCAGADPHFMNHSPMQDRVKYAGIGGIVFATGVLAAFSGGFAFHTIFGPKGDAVDIGALTTLADILGSSVFGFFWGLIIFNLDRFIVSSTGKGDGTDNITGKEFLQAIPRIFIAIVLGIAISAPLEIRILQNEIDAELQKFQEKYVQELNNETDKVATQQKAVLEKRKAEYEQKLAAYNNELKTFDDYINNLVEKRQAEMQDKRAYGEGPVAKAMQRDIDNKKTERDNFIKGKVKELQGINAQLENVNTEISNYEKELRLAYAKNKKEAGNYSGLLKRIQISHEVGGWVPWIILAVLLCIETGPIFFKMMMTKGVYDYKVENFNLLRRA